MKIYFFENFLKFVIFDTFLRKFLHQKSHAEAIEWIIIIFAFIYMKNDSGYLVIVQFECLETLHFLRTRP